jgi:hypothetical protein
MSKYVYFIRPVGQPQGNTKIGCSDAPENRLSTLMAWSPVPLEIVHTVEGDFDLEARIHGRFMAWHSHREWFYWSQDLENFICQLRAGVPVENATDWAGYGKVKKPRAGWTKEHSERRSYHTRVYHTNKKIRIQTGQAYNVPPEVERILARWSGAGRTTPTRPTDSEFAALDAFIARKPA